MFHPALLAAQTALMGAVTAVTPALPAVADFKTGTYTYNGEAVTLADLFEENTDWGNFDGSEIIASTGLTGGGSPVSTDTFFALLASGFTVVMEWTFASSEAGNQVLALELTDLPNYTVENYFTIDESGSAITVTDWSTSDSDTFSGEGSHKTALTFTNALFAASTDGNTAISIDPTDQTPQHFCVSCQLDFVVEKLTFMTAQDAATLATLSA